ncbi:MAG: hypothetical protein H6686_05750 [Fibrobacteria bacterium]|nr:hypothetical protein [Fibrobacteria bacterium]
MIVGRNWIRRSLTALAATVLFGAIGVGHADVKTFTVSIRAGQGTHTDIQKAINDCAPTDICTIQLIDSVYTLMRSIWIEGKSNLTITGKRSTKPIIQYLPTLLTKKANPNAALGGGTPPATVAGLFNQPFVDPVTGVADPKRPAGWLMWPFKGSTSDLPLAGSDPGHSNDTTTGYSSSGFQYNGMFVVRKSQDITIRGLMLRSTPTYFQNQGVWGGAYDVLFGNVGINLMQSLRAKVQDCDITGFFTAFYIQGRNVGGAFGRPNPNDIDDADIVPLSRYGQVGDHLIERNYVYNNWWFAYNEIDWDLGSTIRYNVAFQNMNKAFQYGDTLTDKAAATSEMNNMTGGFMYSKDAVIIPHRMYNNTIMSSPIVLGHGYWRRNVQSLFYNNVLTFVNLSTGGTKPIGPTDQHNLLGWYGEMAWHNTLQLFPGMEKVEYKSSGSFQITDSTVVGEYGPGSTCKGGCFINSIPLDPPYVSQLQPNQLFNSWNIQQGVTLTLNGDSIPWKATTTGYEGKTYTVFEKNGYALWGLFDKLPGIDTVSARLRKNFWAIKIPTQGNIDSTTKTATLAQLAPLWGDPVVTATIRNQAWRNADLGGPDGSVSDRGAFQYDSVSGKTVLGGIRNGVQLEVVDQRIVDMKLTRVKIPMIYQQRNGDQLLPSYYTDIKVDSVYYYKEFPFSDTADGDATQDPFPGAAVIRTGLNWSGVSGDSLIFNVPAGVTYDYARFDIFVSAVDPVSGERVRTVASYVYRKTQYKLLVEFCTNGTSDATCSASLVNRTRVGEAVNMRITILDADGLPAPTQTVNNLMVTPGAGSVMVDPVTGKGIDTSVFRATFKGSVIAPVEFRTVGLTEVGAAGIHPLQTGGAEGIMGAGQIFVAAGPPYRVQWVNPASTSVVPCKPDPVAPYPLDTLTFCGDILPPSGLTQAELRVYDRFGNQVTEAAKVKVSGTNTNNPLLAQGISMVAASVAGPSTDSVTILTDSIGRGNVWITGSQSFPGGPFPIGWVQFLAHVDSAAVLPVDTARMRLGKPELRLFWAHPVAIDTTIRTSVPVRLVVSMDTVPETTGAYATGTVRVWPSQTRSIIFYKDPARTIPVTDSTVQLVGGEITLWIASEFATPENDLLAEMAGLGGTPTYKSVKFYVPPPPPSPVADSAVFLDRNCDGVSDVARLWLKGTGTIPAALDTSKVMPEWFVVSYPDGTTDSIGATGWKTVGGNFAVLDLPLLHAPRTTAPVGELTMQVRLRRPPADDTVVFVGAKISVLDRVAPRPTAGAIIENFTPGVTADTVHVSFSEPIVFAGTAWPFLTREPNGTLVNTSTIVVGPLPTTPTTKLSFVLTGNAGGALVHAGQSIAIDSTALLIDVQGNHGKGGECLGDTAVLSLVTQPVPLVRSWIQDVDGDGGADRISVVFVRALRSVDFPDSLVATWGNLDRTLLMASATTVDSTTWVWSLPASFPVGVTVGAGPAGAGTLELRDLAGNIERRQSVPMADSVPAIPVSAALTYGVGGARDTLFVVYSEPMQAIRTSGSWMLDQRLADAALDIGSAKATAADPTRWIMLVDPAAANYPRPGDSIRLASGVASNLADLQKNDPSSPKSPYVEVIGPPIGMVSAFLRDADGDGAADQVSSTFLRPLRPSDLPDSLRVLWNGEVRLVPFKVARTTDSVTWILDLPKAFAKGVTMGAGTDGSDQVYLRKDNALGRREEATKLADSVAPIAVSAALRYGNGGALDSLVVTYSEPLQFRTGSEWMRRQKGGDVVIEGIQGGNADAAKTTWTLMVDPKKPGFARPGDSIRLPSGAASSLADARGVLPSSPLSPWVVVVGGDRGPARAWYKDSNGDGQVDLAVLEFDEPLTGNPRYELHWAGETRSADSSAFVAAAPGATRLEIRLTQPFAFGRTSSSSAESFGVQTSGGNGSPISVANFPVADSVPPVILRAHVGYSRLENPGDRDTLFLKLSEPSKATGTTVVLGRGQDGSAYPIAEGMTSVVGILQVSSDSLLFFCDTSCIDAPTKAGMPSNGDSVRLTMPRSGVEITDVLGNAPGIEAKWTLVSAGDRPYTYVVNIFPSGVLVEDPAVPADPGIKSKPTLSVWVFRDGRWWELVDGKLTGESHPAGPDGVIERNGVGLKIDINNAFNSNVLLYDNLGVHAFNTEINIDSAAAKALGNSAGKFSVLILFNGRREGQITKIMGSGVYLMRYLTFRDELQPNGIREKKIVENRIFKLGIKVPTK